MWPFLIPDVPPAVRVLLPTLSLTNSPLQILTPNISVLFGGGRASSSTGALCGEQEAAVGVRGVDTQASKSCCFSGNDALFLMDGGGICLEVMWLRGCRWAVLRKRGVVYAGRKSGSEAGAWPWVPPSAGACPSSLWDVPAGGGGSAVPGICSTIT